MSNEAAIAAARALFGSIEKGDVEGVRQIYAPHAKIWHNTDGIEQNVEQNLAVLAWVIANIKDVRYTDARLQPTASGFVQQHVLRGIFNRSEIAIPACIVAIVENGLISRIDEYLDSAQVAQLR